MNKKNLIWILSVLLVFLIPCLIFLASFKTTAFNINFYEDEFNKYNPDVDNNIQITQDLLFFLRNKPNDELLVNSFTKEEISHLIDAKKVMHRFLTIMNLAAFATIAILIALFYLEPKKFLKYLSASLSLGGFLTLLLSLISYILLKSFNETFIKFHQIFFPMGNWQFSSGHLLIKLFPEQFWIDIISKIIIQIVVSASILMVVSVLVLWFLKHWQIDSLKM